ncbi:NADH dehydrogenase subunit N [Rickettsia akari str. Hartford]|uniref:NADH dehydrogenase subunit N n=1 Tax=Rickettsia akari (strain Hartford) TaxID=293614 RepID=A8GNK1_RICAH|nr:NADH dehydrogenase subunit N [Rickettsia akari str. Hartford]
MERKKVLAVIPWLDSGISIGISKSIVLIFTIISMIIYRDYSILVAEELKFEFITLILLSVVGLFVAISSQNFILLYGIHKNNKNTLNTRSSRWMITEKG